MRSSALASGFARASSGFAKASETAFGVGLSALAEGVSDVAVELAAGLADGLSSVAAVLPHAERSIAPTRTTRTLERRFGMARG